MKVTYTVIPAGQLAGMLHFRVVASDDFDPVQALENITNYVTAQPKVIAIHDDGAISAHIAELITRLRNDGNYLIIYVTYREEVTYLWPLADRVVLLSSVSTYSGTPAHEVHLHFNADEDFDTYPMVAPLGSQQTSLFAYTDKERYNDLISWARRNERPIGILTKVM